jgi:hypothetical protein
MSGIEDNNVVVKETCMKKCVLLVAVLGLVFSMSASASIMIPWNASQGKYILEMPMSTAYSPESTTGTFTNQNGDKWVTGTGGNGYGTGTWHFALENGTAATEVTVSVTVYNRGPDNSVGYHITDFGVSAGAVNQLVGEFWGNDVVNKSEGDFKTYSATFSDLNATDLYLTHVISNGQGYATAQQLRSITISAVPEPATLCLLAFCLLGMVRKNK